MLFAFACLCCMQMTAQKKSDFRKSKKNNHHAEYVIDIQPDPVARKARPDRHPLGIEMPMLLGHGSAKQLHGIDVSHYQGRINWDEVANDPNVLLCDEATSALDPQTTRSILHLLKHLNETLGITIVLITHEMAVVKEICSRVAVMEHGSVVEQGDIFSIFVSPKQTVTQDFIRTTSNLQKIEELIAENAPITQLKPGELIVRLSYTERNTSEALISSASRQFEIDINIIFANIESVQGAPIGGTVAIISGARERITAAIAYLIKKNVGVEVLKDARVA